VRIVLALVLPFVILGLALIVTQPRIYVFPVSAARIEQGALLTGVVVGYLAIPPGLRKRSVVGSIIIAAVYFPVMIVQLIYFGLWWASFFFGRNL
jgi:hypothetical protein